MRTELEEQRHMRWLQRLLVLTLVLILMGILLGDWFTDEQPGWEKAEAELSINRLQQNVALVHSEWMRTGRANSVVIQTRPDAAGEQLSVQVNRFGYPDANVGCAVLWQQLANADDNLAISASLSDGVCEYRLGQKRLFIYKARSGQVIRLN